MSRITLKKRTIDKIISYLFISFDIKGNETFGKCNVNLHDKNQI